MCVSLQTGQITGLQNCGAGFYLTAYGCFTQGPCPSGQALGGDTCVNVINGPNSSAEPPPYCPAGQIWKYNACVQCSDGEPGCAGLGNQCPAGLAATQYGCLPQGNCPAGQVTYGNTCVSVQFPYQYPQYGYPNYYGTGTYPYGGYYRF